MACREGYNAAMLRVLLCCLPLLAIAAEPVVIERAEFGLFSAEGRDALVFEPADVIPHRVGQRYGWVITLKTAKRSLAVREEYLLGPTAPITEAPPGSIVTPLPRRNQVSQRQLVPIDGRIYGEWAIGPQEPPGRRQLRVVIEERAEVVFDYEVR
ncbi:MAG: hypothetical protein N3C63_06940 [Rhodocyclaceae bacterium]|nr:hypothetical protein [Rhodocyclaceae bacterium]